MDVTYRLTAEDYAYFLRHNIRRSEEYKRGTTYWWHMPTACLAICIAGLISKEKKNAALIGIAAGAIWTLSVYLYRYRQALDKWCVSHAEQAFMPGTVQLIVNEESLIEIHTPNRAEVRWDDVCRIEETDNYIFIYFSPSQVAIVPKLGFGVPEEYDDLKRYVKNCFQKRSV
ncbi:MAG: hypothetical protein JWN70_6046 [Planctomycetaceae bacterium]|nr:hypothetical protein [Planctomycetaceae bacterium]